MTFNRTQGAIIGVLGLLSFVIGFVFLPDVTFSRFDANVFVVIGFLLLGISIAQPLFSKMKEKM